MSTTRPFARIDGSVSQPRSSASAFLLPPFGTEWTLHVTESSVRADLTVLLRTVCLQDEDVWSMCHWSSTLSEPCVADRIPAGAPESVRTAADEPPLLIRQGNRRVAPLAGACALGGAAILAWLSITVLSRCDLETGAAAALQPVAALSTSATMPRIEARQRVATVPAHAPARASRLHAHSTHRIHLGKRNKIHFAHRKLNAEPAHNAADATLPLHRNSIGNNIGNAAGDSEWMNHISQRRLTEVPDEFAR